MILDPPFRSLRAALLLAAATLSAPDAAWAQLTRTALSAERVGHRGLGPLAHQQPPATAGSGTAPPRAASNQTVDHATVTTEHEVRVTGLAPGHALLLRRGLDRRHAGGQRRQPLLRHRPHHGGRPNRPASGCWATRAPATQEQEDVRDAYYSLHRQPPHRPLADAGRQRLRHRQRQRDAGPPVRHVPDDAAQVGAVPHPRQPRVGQQRRRSLALPQPHHAHRGRGGRRGLRHRGLLLLRLRQHPLHLPGLVRVQPLGQRGHGHLAAQRPRRQHPDLDHRLLAPPALLEGVARLGRRGAS